MQFKIERWHRRYHLFNEEFSNNDSVLVLLGDNIFNYDLKNAVKTFEKSLGP